MTSTKTIPSPGSKTAQFIAKRRFSSAKLRQRQLDSQMPYTLAISRDVPDSYEHALSKFTTNVDPINIELMKQQHENYVTTLRKYVPTLCLPPLHEHPDSVFVEDTVVAIGSIAVITNPGHPSRRGEVDSMKEILSQLGFSSIIDMRDENPTSICDGGDVLYTGRHLFVGLSERTNLECVDVLSNAFSNDNNDDNNDNSVETIAVPLETEEALHLKSVVTHMDSNTLLAPIGKTGDDVLEAMFATTTATTATSLGYTVIRLPSMLASNIVAVNGGIIAQDAGCNESREILLHAAAERNLAIEFVTASEAAKCDGALTCCSVLLSI